MDYKKTLNMPKTSFEMKANLVVKEPKYLKLWKENQIYNKVLEKNKDNPHFVLHDGPPYANGDLHIGHALNRILKDIIVRYKSLKGFYSPFVLGWDTHGLPIEHKMLKEANINKDELTPLILRKKAAKYAYKQVEKQKKQLEKLEMLTDLDTYYITMDKHYEAQQLRLFKKMVMDGLVYKGLKPVYWSPSSQSALAEAEVEYQDVVSPSIYVAFKIVSTTEKNKVHVNDHLIIWTTTPWTLIANSGVALGEEFSYTRLKYENKVYIVASELLEKVTQLFGWENYEILEVLTAKDIVGATYLTPITHQEAKVVFGHHVTLESGTGLVHIAPLFGEDDFLIGQKNKLNMIMHIADDGKIDYECKYNGVFYEDANKIIIDDLKNNNSLVKEAKLKHPYPHDWRTHQPIMYRGTPQWFVSIDKIRNKILNEIEKVKFYPEWAQKRLSQMIENRGDWTISRQRSWGVPIIIFYDKNKKPVINEEIFDYVINLVQEHGSDIWWEKDADELLPQEYRNLGYTKEMDIMDVWFDSGSSSISYHIPNTNVPYDLYLEGVDQYRGWFNSSIINSVAYYGFAPYKQLISHGFTLDGKGEKMSKSKGNVIDPTSVAKERGADILRLWVANSEYSNDVSISNEILDQNAELYRKLRNTIRFLLGNLDGFKYDATLEREGIHLYIKEELELLKNKVVNYYDQFKFINVIKEINNYIVDLSSFYLSVTKDILYVDKKDSKRRLMTLTNFYEIVEFLVVALAPIIPATAEEIYEHFDKVNKKESVMLEEFPQVKPVNFAILDKFKVFFELRDKVNQLIENAVKNHQIKRSNEAKLYLDVHDQFLASLDLKLLLMVGDIEFSDKFALEVFKSEKCARCWNHFLPNLIVDQLCPNCSSIIADLVKEQNLNE
ncbi:isoleucine--tRNA ligase [Mycoplasmopsis ciconiae]|uniref:Isoleucine--tRNA ligase n=1 Tax=Mycoplasmopsis ciconiae TaxID=561067 RepID=A0ABU7MMY8_9BACT|nr:isoleucine--tRNA ligase [Mycoplasmopsis ciconiae]